VKSISCRFRDWERARAVDDTTTTTTTTTSLPPASASITASVTMAHCSASRRRHPCSWLVHAAVIARAQIGSVVALSTANLSRRLPCSRQSVNMHGRCRALAVLYTQSLSSHRLYRPSSDAGSLSAAVAANAGRLADIDCVREFHS